VTAAAAAVDCGSLPPVLQAACYGARLGGPGGLVPAAASGVVDAAAQSVFAGAVAFVVDGAVWLLTWVGALLETSTRVDVHAAWFAAHYRVMVGLAASVCALFLLLSAAGTVVHQDPRRLGRHAASVAAAGVGSGCVVALTGLLLAVTDELCAAVTGGTRTDLARALHGPAAALTGMAGGSVLLGRSRVPMFAVLLLALLIAVACLVIWLELLLRSAAVYVAVLFLPLALAGLVWEPTRRWAARLARTLVALILSKFVIVVILTTGTSALASGSDGASGVLAGAAMLLVAMFSPFLVFRITGVFDDAGGHAALDGVRSRGMWHTIYAGSSLLRTAQSMRQRSAAGGGRAATSSGGRTATRGGVTRALASSPVALVAVGAFTAGRKVAGAARRTAQTAGAIHREFRRPRPGASS
jgi:hypothetical protein